MNLEKTAYFFVPGLSQRYRTGGLLVIQDVARLFEKHLGFRTHFVTTNETHPGAVNPKQMTAGLCIVTWGPLVEKHIKLIQKHSPNSRIIYYAQSFGWGIEVAPRIPIVCVSRYVMAQWALYSQGNPIAYIPPALNPCFKFENHPRDIDILVHTRKQNKYCLTRLVPLLTTKSYKITAINEWIAQEQFAQLLNCTKLFLYITELHRASFFRRLPGEGFGLPALEALACGCVVGSNLLGGVTDFLTPGENCINLQTGDLECDLQQIDKALKEFQPQVQAAETIASEYSQSHIADRWKTFLETF